jgi:transposase
MCEWNFVRNLFSKRKSTGQGLDDNSEVIGPQWSGYFGSHWAKNLIPDNSENPICSSNLFVKTEVVGPFSMIYHSLVSEITNRYMAGQRIGIMELRSLITLKLKGLSNRKVADLLQINRKTIDSYTSRFTALNLSFEELIKLDEADLRDLFIEDGQTEKQRYEQLSAQFSYFEKELRKPGCTLQVLWKRYLEQNPQGYKYTQFTWHYRRWRTLNNHSGKLEHKAGEKLYVDFCGKKLSYFDKSSGEQTEVEVFVGVLPCSQYTFVTTVASQKREDFIDSLESCLKWMGGVPQAIVSDNLKSAVSKGSKYAPIINKTFADFALHYGCVVDPTRPYHPQDKALVERSVELVYQRIYYPLSKFIFFNITDLNKAIATLLIDYNDHLFSHGGGSRRSYFIDLEKQYLQPLPAGSYSIRHYRRAKVQRTAHIFLSEDRNYYSVPYRFTGLHVEVQFNQNHVEILYNHDRIALHKRSYRPGHYTTVADHMPSTHQAYQQWSPQHFEERAKQVGPSASEYIGKLLTQYSYPEIAYKQAQGILSFLKQYDRIRLENACKRALHYYKASYHTVASILKNNLDLEELPQQQQESSIGEHDNIRGAAHYH